MTQLINHYATHQASVRPDDIAIVSGNQKLTYAELEDQSNRLANLIIRAGCEQGDRICLFMDKMPAAIVAMHGIMKADCVYVPIDITSPPPRVQRIVESCRPRLVLIDQAGSKLLHAVLQQLPETQVLNSEERLKA